jgi:hypothetical protein
MAHPVRSVLWAALALLAIGLVVACLPAVPVTASGLAVVTVGTGERDDAPRIAVLMPEDQLDRIAPGVGANVHLGADDRGLKGTVVAVEPEPLTADEVRSALALPGTALAVLPPSVAMVWVIPEVDARGQELGGFGWADIEVGSTPAGAYLPLVGTLFEE